MLINSHYPQIPLATSNVATDLARADNQQRPPVIPPQQPTSAHHERAFNPQNERAPAYQIVEQKQQQQHSDAQRQAIVQQLLAPKSAVSQLVNVVANDTPTLQRRDIRIKHLTTPAQQSKTDIEKASDESEVNAAYFQQVREHVGQFYGQHNNPTPSPSFSAYV
ncbi:hypothetical protein [Shewanella gaetbuli]|uniref:Uncharacterized protein n=1 Tax=Shewanella gaetbuli TaxID=220752 RepID=A0A9X2CGW8_9GAMM|nr:hypothetical protein [Shewanella gaetbuli]MCL1142848.1 hypothetical protein [Shewanella gaetbuli]